MGVLMKPMDLAWALLKADPNYRVRDHKTLRTGSSYGQAMHPAIAGHLHRRINQTRMGEEGLNEEPSPFGEQTTVAGRLPRKRLERNPQDYTDLPTGEMERATLGFGGGPMAQLSGRMDTADYGYGSKARILGDKPPGVSVSNRPDMRMINTPDTVLNLLQIPGAAPSPMNYFQTNFDPYKPQEYGQMSSRDSEDFEEVFNRFMEERRRGNPDNVQMLPGNVMQHM